MLLRTAGLQAARGAESLLTWSGRPSEAPAARELLRSVSLVIQSALGLPATDAAYGRQQLWAQQQHASSLQQQVPQLLYPLYSQQQPVCWPSQQSRTPALQPSVLQSCSNSSHCKAYSSRVTAVPNPSHSRTPLGMSATAAQQKSKSLLTQQPHQMQQQQGLKQLRSYDEAPTPLPRFRKPSKDGRMNKMVIRVPPQVQLDLKDQQLIFTGKAGSTSLSLPFLDPTGLVAWQCYTQTTAAAAAGPGTGSLLLLASPSKRCWRGIQTHINNAVHGVMQGYLVGVTVQGVGYRLEPVADTAIAAALAARTGSAADADASSSSSSSKRRIIWEQEAEKTNIAYPHKQPAKAVRLKVGYTRACIFQLPEGVLAFFVKPTLMYLYGIDKALVTNTAAAIRAIRKPNAYTGNGIQLVGETLKLKQRAGSK